MVSQRQSHRGRSRFAQECRSRGRAYNPIKRPQDPYLDAASKIVSLPPSQVAEVDEHLTKNDVNQMGVCQMTSDKENARNVNNGVTIGVAHGVAHRTLRNQRRVHFNLDAIETYEVEPFSEVYGIHPRDFVFGKDYSIIPAFQHIAMDVLVAERLSASRQKDGHSNNEDSEDSEDEVDSSDAEDF
eukprot:TRINITY_DN15323_c1_g1_i2.p1 TRINITY_DN15323_c1_g1~~TRINITY_DN15323_c1_g1_i2.p1  ORF type:complete len:185 (+),score=25.65 TRINITY_DN15323_c1_g1_i2:89-643(+)